MSVVPRSYDKIHKRLRRLHGPARNFTCPCGSPAEEWAYQFTGDPELRDENGEFPHSDNPDDYMAMCRPCHIRTAKDHKPEQERPDYPIVVPVPRDRVVICAVCELVTTPRGITSHELSTGHGESYEITD